MSIKRFVAPTSREALRQVREALGGDAVIFANRPCADGVEILAASADAVTALTAPPPKAPEPKPAPIAAPAVRAPTIEAISPPQFSSSAEVIAQAQMARAKRVVTPEAIRQPAPQATPRERTPEQDSRLAEEIRSMRGFIEDQLASLAWTDSMRKQPGRMKIMQQLLRAGFSPLLARHLQQNLPDDYSDKQAAAWLANVLEKNIQCVGAEEDLIDRGGVFALVGPTGVGKTTTTAKLAARFAVKYGADNLALITTDGYRIGAQDQLRIYGKILGVQVHTIQDEASLSSAMQYLSRKRLVLIDTAGMGQRDQRVAEQIAMLRGARAERLLVLNAAVQAETLEDVVTAYADASFRGCVLSKLDEAVRLGGALDVVIRHRLRIHYISNGQRVPEDLHHATPRLLAHRTLKEAAPAKAFALQEEDYPAWLGAAAKGMRHEGEEGSRV